jgi:hypothetical protein
VDSKDRHNIFCKTNYFYKTEGEKYQRNEERIQSMKTEKLKTNLK